MLNSLKNMVSNVLYAPSVQQAQRTAASNAAVSKSGYNPFENPFLQPASARTSFGVNKPVKGGYFAGYYNGKPNIVGRKLFIEA